MTSSRAPRLILIAPWFGPWPVWINLYLESCRWNDWVTWLIPTDQDPPENQPPNAIFQPMTTEELFERAGDLTGLDLRGHPAYKLCDIRPVFGTLFEDDIAGHSHFGYTDHDIIYGQLSCELTPERLNSYEVISGHAKLQAGHLSVFQNTARMRNAWKRMPGVRRAMKTPQHVGFDERGFGRRLDPTKWHPPWRRYTALWHEMHSMPDRSPTWLDGGSHPTRFTWHDGRLTEPRNAKPQYAYLHFMLWRSNHYRYVNRYGPAPWPERDKLMHVDWREAAEQGFEISHDGFTPRRKG